MKTSDRPSLLSRVIAREFRTISTSYAVLLVLVGGIFLYGLLYNYMYAPNHVTGAPVVVVDHSHSSLSREYARLLDATPQVDIYGYAADFREAEELMKQQKAVGILYLPRDFADRVFRGEEAVFVLYASTNAFLYYLSLQEASAYVMLAISDTYRTSGIVFLPLTAIVAVATAPAPINLSGTVLYNYTEGYGSYLIPAVLMLILFQTLMMVIGMLNGEEHYTGGLREYLSSGTGWGSAARLVCGKTFVYCMLYAVFSLFLLGLIPRLFSVPHIGHGLDIVVMLIPFFLATCFLGLAASRYYKDSESPLLMITFFSVGFLFLAGVSYPLELMPWYWRMAHYMIPASSGTLAFVQLNSMGASLADIREPYFAMWIQTGVYFLLAVWVYRDKLSVLGNKPDAETESVENQTL